jgi:tetratricopeptide (TPR) repeat protein
VTQSLKIEPHKTDPTRWLAPLLVVAAVALAYCNSFQGEMVFDDVPSLKNNPEIQHLIPRQYSDIATTLNGRPVLRFSFALDYAVAGLNLAVFHTTNLVIHIGSCLLVYGIIRRMLLRQEIWGDRFTQSAPWLGAAVAGLWGVHPLNTESVAYLVQRAESLASMFYLAVIYCVIRASESPETSRRWQFGAVAAAVLGMGTKEMVVTVPVAAFLFDRIFLKGRGRDRWLMYVGMCLGWLLIGWGILHNKRGPSVSLHSWLSPKEYALTQLDVIAHYLRLMVWPRGLAFDADDWPVCESLRDIGWPGWFVIGLALLTLILLIRRPKIGFVGAWFFLILLPSSSVVPIVTEIVAEHRMYLPMLGWIALAVIGGWILLEQMRAGRWIGIAATVVVGVALIVTTIFRNADYYTSESLWRDTIAKRPNDARAHYDLAQALSAKAHTYDQGSDEFIAASAEAATEYRQCLELNPAYSEDETPLYLASALADAGDLSGAESVCAKIIANYPDHAPAAHLLRGKLFVAQKNWQGAKEDFEAAAAANPNDPEPHYVLAMALKGLHDVPGAEVELAKTLQVDPRYHDAALQLILLRAGPQTR